MPSGKEVDKAISNVFQFLNLLDLMPCIKSFENKTIRDLMDSLENEFPYKDEYSATLFDAVAEDEFVDYINKKYNLNIREEVTYYYPIRL